MEAMLRTAMVAALLWMATSAAGFTQTLPDFTGLVEANENSVVNVQAIRSARTNGFARRPESPHPDFDEFWQRFFGAPGDQDPDAETASSGSGFIISADGYILTNHHVVENAAEVQVRLKDRRVYDAEVIGSDPLSDIALLRIESNGLNPVRLGDSSVLKPGQWVLAIGSPFNFEYTVTAGIVSAVNRSFPNQNYVPFIQTDVPINRGNSGGPLINMEGEVIGINSQIYSYTGGYMGLSFAIPIEVAMDVVEQLKTNGRVVRGWLGVGIQAVDQDLANALGLKKVIGAAVNDVMPGSPAQNGGLQVGDVIVVYAGQEVTRHSDLPPMVGATAPGTSAQMTIVRDGRRQPLKLQIGERPGDDEILVAEANANDRDAGRLGLIVDDLTAEQRADLGLEGGVVVSRVIGRSARRAGIAPGDVIVTLDNQKVDSARAFERRAHEFEPGDTVALLVRRGRLSTFVTIRIPDEN
ncbi:MAG: Do family serine endopeptidase [Gammaproteobacteria bacterium]|nr:MAG: Do family serine endopeptidase [Gammaproteobacteria bacterium]